MGVVDFYFCIHCHFYINHLLSEQKIFPVQINHQRDFRSGVLGLVYPSKNQASLPPPSGGHNDIGSQSWKGC